MTYHRNVHNIKTQLRGLKGGQVQMRNILPDKYHRLLADWLMPMRAAIAKHGTREGQELFHKLVEDIGKEILKDNPHFKISAFYGYCGYGSDTNHSLRGIFEPVQLPRNQYRHFYRWFRSIDSIVQAHCNDQLKNTFVWWLTKIAVILGKNNPDFRSDVFMRECGYGQWHTDHILSQKPYGVAAQEPQANEFGELPEDNVGNH